MQPTRQHLIDPEICIRCNTCEETCPVNAITHNADNYVVDASKCNFCLDCISPCPTGSIDNWRVVERSYSLEEQLEWEDLPEQLEIVEDSGDRDEALELEVQNLLQQAHAGQGGRSVRPVSASEPYINLFSRTEPLVGRVAGNYTITNSETESDIHHIVLDFGASAFPVLEGQSIGIVPPGRDESGRAHPIRLYSVASPRNGERPNHNNLSLTVKRVIESESGEKIPGLCSNFLCDLVKGDTVEVTGPFGSTFLMPNAPTANIIMICTGTGSAPFRAMTEQRRRTRPLAEGRLMLFFGARTPEELPYFGPLSRLPASFLDKELVFSRLPGKPKEYVQDRMLTRSGDIARLLQDDETYVYICGLKGMEEGVEASFQKICSDNALNWSDLIATMRCTGRYHCETY
ncbi:benzoyl-CoA 2,3-epoxidase subunit BoxA [Haliea sp.]